MGDRRPHGGAGTLPAGSSRLPGEGHHAPNVQRAVHRDRRRRLGGRGGLAAPRPPVSASPIGHGRQAPTAMTPSPGQSPCARGESIVRPYRDVLTVRDARALIGASAASQVGNWLYNAALLGYVYSATHSAGWVGAATVCRLVPYVLLGPFGGPSPTAIAGAPYCWPVTPCGCSSWPPSLRRSPAPARWR